MFKITFKAQGTNFLSAMDRLKMLGPEGNQSDGKITLMAPDYAPIQSMVEDLSVTEWSAVQQD